MIITENWETYKPTTLSYRKKSEFDLRRMKLNWEWKPGEKKLILLTYWIILYETNRMKKRENAA